MRPEIILAALAVALPTVTALVGILLSRNDYNKLDSRLSSEVGRLDGRLSGVEARLESKISGLENRLHSDMMQVIGKLTELEVRVARLEEKQAR